MLARDLRFFFPTPCIWIFSMGRCYCESEGKCTGCQAHNGIILLFQYVCVSLCKEKGDLQCRGAGECSGTVQGSSVARCGRASATVPLLLGSGGHCLGLSLSHACPRKMGEACTAIHYAACKPHKAKYSKVVMFPVLSLNFQKSDGKMNCADPVLPHCEAIYCKGCIV